MIGLVVAMTKHMFGCELCFVFVVWTFVVCGSSYLFLMFYLLLFVLLVICFLFVCGLCVVLICLCKLLCIVSFVSLL